MIEHESGGDDAAEFGDVEMETEGERAERHERERIEAGERYEQERKDSHERHERERKEDRDERERDDAGDQT